MLTRRGAVLGLSALSLAPSVITPAKAVVIRCQTPVRFKYPLNGVFNSSRITLGFGANWVRTDPCTGRIKKHNGIDIVDGSNTSPGSPVYAAWDGTIVQFVLDNTGWRYGMVIDHCGQFTTVYWHIEPIPSAGAGVQVVAGTKIATVANMGSNTHLHFGIRMAPYNGSVSVTGALPQTPCDGYPAFSAGFINPAQQSYY